MLLATYQNGFRNKTTPTLTTPLVRTNMSCAVAIIFSSLDFLSLSISMAKLSSLVATTFSSLALLSSSVSTANLSCSLSTTFSSFRFLSHSLSSPRFNLLRAAGVVVFCFRTFASYPQPFFPLVSEALFSLSFSFLSERSFRPC